ncbi:sulfatase [Beutenbergia cavernae DSM 12333]|uniref:Sulfatase n=1 Tax=Beutenbergia cavernae (strain ATCC BAA-8 / DSM 12333 / CCUG 43141 / JCM 11478 / NBRC 16432 / NCIMB 13614 / HKI 0122) TaxID=471853 RepID=C5BYA8_BEUC1|nr:sulfatase [Beutenbergia cavernae]ACQ81008.1 sulfatase [Beutenbergia cavernae DSM 12333]
MARRPNICLILTDDHAAHAVGTYGSVVNSTPRIDEIAQRGWRLDNLFCTNSICTPSRASILTGQHSHTNGVRTLSTPMDRELPTFVSQLKDAGYRTAIVGKWHLGEGEEHRPRAFDHWMILRDQGEYHDPTFRTPDGLRTVTGYATDVITDLALQWLDDLDYGPDGTDSPWCLLIHHKAPHRSWEPDEAHRAQFAGRPIPVPATFTDDYATRSGAAHRAAMRVADQLTRRDLKADPPAGLSYEDEALWKYQRYMEDYLACVASVDDNVGRVIDRLAERGELDDTLLMYTSDQGFFLGDHGWFDKRFMYDESIRMPFVVSCPTALDGGRSTDQIVTNVDLARTILEAADVEPHPGMQGESFWGTLARGETPPADQSFYYRYWEHDDGAHHAAGHYGIRTERYKLIYFYNDGLGLPGTGWATYAPEWELYDLEADPDELVNVADDPTYAVVRRDLTERLAREQAAAGDVPYADPGPVPAR